jgi:hypothetical protein
MKQLRNGGAWVHIVCALWLPEVDIDGSFDDIDVRRVASYRYDRVRYRVSSI